MSQSVAGPSHGGYRSSSHDYMRCPLCPQDCNARYKGQRGVNIHIGKTHPKNPPSQPLTPPSNANTTTPSDEPLHEQLINFKKRQPVVKRILRGARLSVANKLSSVLRLVIDENSIDSNKKQLLKPTFRNQPNKIQLPP
ncbi:hypothetical protein JYU34_012061 [Plutella xylostella]|uniref:C2H2-type domain-containing protein n=1 Tax=Plutella xylostella TaxID=51655 RepID=A0ABQ7QEA0_PLUXY|nr:hypothetical protein JYU34_012061 [Plutella xylostella]